MLVLQWQAMAVITSTDNVDFPGGLAMSRPGSAPRRRRRRGELREAMREYLESRKGQTASISEIKAAVTLKLGVAPDSSYRSALQDERYFRRVSRGVFTLRTDD
jgi:hypothetical protein